MLYNKSKYRKVNDKKVLHKIGKRWVTLSIAMLALLGGGAAASHVTHAASTTPAAKPAVNKPANSVSSAKTKLVKPQSASNLTNSQSASASSSAVSGKPASSVSTSAASKSTSFVTPTKSSANNSNQVTSDKTSSTSSTKASTSVSSNSQSKSKISNRNDSQSSSLSSNSNHPKMMFGAMNLRTQSETHANASSILDPATLISTLINSVNNDVKPLGPNQSNALKSYNDILTRLSPKNLSSLANNTNVTAASWVSDISGLATDVNNIKSNGTPDDNLQNISNALTGLQNQLNGYLNNSFSGLILSMKSYSLYQIATKFDGINDGSPTIHSLLLSVTHEPEQDLDQAGAALKTLTKISTINSSGNNGHNAYNYYNNVITDLEELPTSNSQASVLSNISQNVSNLAKDRNINTQNIDTNENSQQNIIDKLKDLGTSISNQAAQFTTIYYKYNGTKEGQYQFPDKKSGQLTVNNASEGFPAGYKLVNNNDTFSYDNTTHDVAIIPIQQTDTIQFMNGSEQVGNTTVTGNDVRTRINGSSTVTLPSGYQLARGADATVANDGHPHQINVTPIQQTDTIQFMNGSKQVGNTTVTGNDVRTRINGSSTVTLPSGYKLAQGANATVTNDGGTHQINVTPVQQTDTIDYQLSNGTTVGSHQFTGNDADAQGADNTSFNASSNLPNGYQVSQGANTTFNYDGQPHTVSVTGNPVTYNVTIHLYFYSGTKQNYHTQSTYSKSGNVGDSIRLFDLTNYINTNVNGFSTNGYTSDDSNANGSFTIPATDGPNSSGNNITKNYTLNFNTNNAIDTINYVLSNNSDTYINNTPITISGTLNHPVANSALTNIPKHYHIVNSNQDFNYDNSTHKVVIAPGLSTDTVDYKNGSTQVGSHQFTGNDVNASKAPNTSFDASSNVPNGYQISPGANTTFNYDGGTYPVSVTPVQKTDTINYKNGSTTVGSHPFTGNDVAAHGASNTSFNASSNLPTGYQVSQGASATFNYDGQPHTVSVTPIQETDIINYKNGTTQVGSQSFTGNDIAARGASNTSFNAGSNLPTGYQVSQGASATFNYDGQPHTVSVTPIQETDTIDYKNGSSIVGSQSFTGNDVAAREASNTSFNASSNLPTGYQLSQGANATFNYDGQPHTVSVTPIQKADTVNYKNGSTTVGSHQFKGNDVEAYKASNTSFDASSNLPTGYQLSQGANATFNYDGQPHTVLVTPIQQTDTINYVYNGQQVGQTTLSGDDSATGLASSHFTVGNNPKGLPLHYRVSNPSQSVDYDGQNHTVGVTPESVNQTVKFMYNGNPINPNSTVSGIYNTHEVVPNDKVPTGWNLANDGSQDITFNASSTPENVDVTPKQLTDTVKYIANGQLKNTQQFKGNVVQTGINDQLTANTLSEGLPNNYEFTTTPASLNYDGGTHTVQIKLNPADKDTDHIRYVVADNKSQQNNQSISGGTPTVSGYRGQNTTVMDSMVPSGYRLANDGTQNIHFGNRSVTNQVDVVPKSVTDYIKFINNNDDQQLGTVIPKHGLYGDFISNLTAPAHYTLADPSKVAGMKFTGQSVPRDVYVTPNHENDVVAYVYNNNNIETNHVSGVYGSKQFINAPSNWKLANGVSSQITLNKPVIRVGVVPNVPKVPANNSSLINGLLNVAKNVNGNSINSYRNLVHIMQPNTLHDLTHNGIEVGTTSDSASNNTILGYINSVCKDVINISNNAPSDTVLKNGLATKLQNAQDMMNQQSNLLNSGESLASGLYGTKYFNLSFMGDRLSNPGGFAHSLLQSILGADTDPLGVGANTLNTILNNASTSSHYQSVISDLNELVPSQHALQQSRILNDVAQNVQAIANDPSMRNISNLDSVRSGKAVSTLQNSVPSIIQASQDYLSPKYNDTDVINYQNNGNTVISVTKTGLDGSQITGVSAPTDYVIATDPGNLMFVKNGDYNVAVKPVQKTDTINYRYSGHTLTKQFTGSVFDRLVINNVPKGIPSDYHVVGNPEFNYDGLTHDVSLQKNAAGYSDDNVDYVVNDSNSQNNGRVLAHATMYGQNGTSAQVLADRVPVGYHLANDLTDRITFSNASASHRADIRPDDNETDTVKYTYQGQQIGSEVTFNNGIYDNDIRVPAPAHYSLVNNGVITIDGSDHNVQVVPNTVHDIINYKYDDQLIGNPETVSGAYGTKGSVTPPANYSLLNNGEVITFDDGHHDVQVTPNQITETVNFVDGNGNSVSSSNVNGTYGTTTDVSSVVPADYKLASGSAEVKLDNQPKTLVVDQIPQPSHDTDNPSTNTDITGGGSIPTPSVPVMPLGPVGPSPMSPQSSASSSIPSESAQPSYVAPSSYQPSDYVAPSASATPKKHAAKANVINIPSLDRHPYVKVGARDVRINPKAIKHAKVLGTVQRGRKVAYRIKAGKVTGYVFGTAKRVPKTALMNGHKRAYVHVGRKTIKLTAKNLKHVRILKTVQKGHNVKFYVKINRKHGSVYARVSVKNYKFDIPKTYNTKYYQALPKQRHYVKIVKPICIYRSYHFNDHARRGHISSGITVRVKRIVYNHGVTRFELTNGKFITANKGCVKVI